MTDHLLKVKQFLKYFLEEKCFRTRTSSFVKIMGAVTFLLYYIEIRMLIYFLNDKYMQLIQKQF